MTHVLKGHVTQTSFLKSSLRLRQNLTVITSLVDYGCLSITNPDPTIIFLLSYCRSSFATVLGVVSVFLEDIVYIFQNIFILLSSDLLIYINFGERRWKRA